MCPSTKRKRKSSSHPLSFLKHNHLNLKNKQKGKYVLNYFTMQTKKKYLLSALPCLMMYRYSVYTLYRVYFKQCQFLTIKSLSTCSSTLISVPAVAGSESSPIIQCTEWTTVAISYISSGNKCLMFANKWKYKQKNCPLTVHGKQNEVGKPLIKKIV